MIIKRRSPVTNKHRFSFFVSDKVVNVFPPRQVSEIWRTGLLTRLALMGLGGLSMLYARWRIMGTGPPAFTEVDNPASFAENVFLRVSERLFNMSFAYLKRDKYILGATRQCKHLIPASPGVIFMNLISVIKHCDRL